MCLRAFLDGDATHAVVLQDDVVVCRNFATTMWVIAHSTDVPVVLFVSATKSHTLRGYRKAIRAKERYAPIWFQDFCPVVGMIWPRAAAQEFWDWSRNPRLPGMPLPPRSDDAVVGSWMKFCRKTILATVPSLVEHPDDTLSVKWHNSRVPSGTKNRYRRAVWYIGDDDPLELDWAKV